MILPADAVIVAASHGPSIYPIVGLIGTGIAILGAVAAAVAYVRTQYAKSTIETLKENNAALTEANKIADAKVLTLTAERDALKQEAENLRGYVSGTEAIHALGDRLANQHTEVMSRITEVTETMAAHLIVEHPRRRPAKKTTATTTTRSRAR